MNQRPVAEIAVLECVSCSYVTVNRILRCSRCRSALRPGRRSGNGSVAGATHTDEHSFAIVDLRAGFQVLAIGSPELRLAVGDYVIVAEHGDGSFDLRAAVGP
jgi:hypothetical protein